MIPQDSCKKMHDRLHEPCMITQDSCKKMHDRLHEPCMITQDSFIRFMHENVPKSCTHMHDLTQVSCMNLAKIHNMIMQEIFAWELEKLYNRPGFIEHVMMYAC